MKSGELSLRLYDDYGEKFYTVSSVKDGMYYLWQRNIEGRRLRYNSHSGIIEHYNEEKQFWDIEIQYIYQLEFIGKGGIITNGI